MRRAKGIFAKCRPWHWGIHESQVSKNVPKILHTTNHLLAKKLPRNASQVPVSKQLVTCFQGVLQNDACCSLLFHKSLDATEFDGNMTPLEQHGTTFFSPKGA